MEMTGERATPGVCHWQKLSRSPSGNIAIKYWHIKGVEIGLLRTGSCVCVCVCVCVCWLLSRVRPHPIRMDSSRKTNTTQPRGAGTFEGPHPELLSSTWIHSEDPRQCSLFGVHKQCVSNHHTVHVK